MVIVWRITEQCNLACGFCSYDRRLVRSRNHADVEEIRRFGAVLAAYQTWTAQRILVSWLGGEPFLWAPLAELSRVFHEEYGLAVSTTTNGTLLGSAQVRRHLVNHYAELTLSIDALDTTHDKLRGRNGLFASLRENTQLLASEIRSAGHGPKLRANVVLMRNTIEDFQALCLELASWGIEEISFNQLGGADRPEFFPANRLLSSQVRAFRENLPELRNTLLARGVRLLGGPGYLDRMAASSEDLRRPIEDCHPGSQFLFIDEKGMVSPCSFTSREYGIPISNLRSEADLRDLSSTFLNARRTRRAPACEDCLSTHVFEKFAESYGS